LELSLHRAFIHFVTWELDHQQPPDCRNWKGRFNMAILEQVLELVRSTQTLSVNELAGLGAVTILGYVSIYMLE
jgi:hypothetical protein